MVRPKKWIDRDAHESGPLADILSHAPIIQAACGHNLTNAGGAGTRTLQCGAEKLSQSREADAALQQR
jgi:hypothetical protein